MRSSDETEKSQASANPETPGNPDVSGVAAGCRGRRPESGVMVEEGAPEVGRPRGEEETRLFQLRGDGGKLGNRADSVVAKYSVAAAAAREGVITPAVQQPHMPQAES